jgi:hypothetical protein
VTGTILQMTADEYHADPAQTPSLSASVGKILMSKSAYHAWLAHPRLNPKYQAEESGTFDIGTAAHALLLEGSRAKICVIEADDWRTKAAKEARDQARASGLTPILARHNVAVIRMVDAAKAFIETTELSGIFQDGAPEQTLVWKDNGVACRSRLDWLTKDRRVILDYKSSASAQPDWFSRQIANMGYDFQAAFYLRGLKACGHPNAQFVFLAQEVEPPHACSLHGIAPSMFAIAEAKVQRAIDLWRQCLTTGKWPAYDNRVHWAEATAWQMTQHEESLLEAAA